MTTIYAENLEEEALKQFTDAMALPCAVQGALMPDAHTGYSLPIGAVVKTIEQVFPAFVGFDIGCGVACLELDINYKEIDLDKLKTHILNEVPIGFNSHTEPQDTSSLIFDGASDKLKDIFSIKGKTQLGTLGGGNHFIEVGYIESNENIAIVIHSGSRGFGHGVASYYMKEAASESINSEWPKERNKYILDFECRNENFKKANFTKFIKSLGKYIDKQKDIYMKSQDIEGLHSFSINSKIGSQYIIDQNICLEYALLNRKTMINKIYQGILSQLDSSATDKRIRFINRNHNHAEITPTGIIHRKGATHADEGMLGVIPGNMRDGSFIVKGKGNPNSLNSSSHGAGRVLSRRKARETLNLEEFQKETEKLITNHTEKMLDEAPKAYKNIFEVMKLQEDLVEVLDRVIPILNIKG